ncbi:hypothetical protein [Streptomyces sp. NPDC002587]
MDGFCSARAAVTPLAKAAQRRTSGTTAPAGWPASCGAWPGITAPALGHQPLFPARDHLDGPWDLLRDIGVLATEESPRAVIQLGQLTTGEQAVGPTASGRR